MAKVIILSRNFPSYHPRKGQPTYFVEKFLNWFWDQDICNYHNVEEMIKGLNGHDNYKLASSCDPEIKEFKGHTIRLGSRWKVGDKASLRVWSEKPYRSKQIIIAPDIEVIKTWDVELNFRQTSPVMFIPQVQKHHLEFSDMIKVANNDGLSIDDFFSWFLFDRKADPFKGQIVCWNKEIKYYDNF